MACISPIAGLNAWLWWLAVHDGRYHDMLGAVFPVLIFVPGTVIAATAPQYAPYIWVLGFGGLLVRRFVRADAPGEG